jgi:hypothetical protein
MEMLLGVRSEVLSLEQLTAKENKLELLKALQSRGKSRVFGKELLTVSVSWARVFSVKALTMAKPTAGL